MRTSANHLTACGLENVVSHGKYVWQVQSSISQDCVLDPAELSSLDKMSQNCAFRDLKFEIDNVPPTYYFQGVCYLEEHVHSRSLSTLPW